jgi:hypothetical protein
VRLSAAAGAALALTLAGCAGPPEQEAAERAVRDAGAGGEVRCTANSRIWFREGPPADFFLCTRRSSHGLCDRFRVDRRGDGYRATLLARDGDCALPVG